MAVTPTHAFVRRKGGNSWTRIPLTPGERLGGFGPGSDLEIHKALPVEEIATKPAATGAPVVATVPTQNVKQGQSGSLNLAAFVSGGSGSYDYSLDQPAPVGVSMSGGTLNYIVNDQAAPGPLSISVRVANAGTALANTIAVTLNIGLSDVVWSTVAGKRDVKGLSVHHPPQTITISGFYEGTFTINPADMVLGPISLTYPVVEVIEGKPTITKSSLWFSIFEPVSLNEDWWVGFGGGPTGFGYVLEAEPGETEIVYVAGSSATDAKGQTKHSFGPDVTVPAQVADGTLPVDVLTVAEGTAPMTGTVLQSGETWQVLRGTWSRAPRSAMAYNSNSVARRGAANRGPVQRAIATLIKGVLTNSSYAGGPAVRVQPNGSCYALVPRSSGMVRLNRIIVNGDDTVTTLTINEINMPDPAWDAADKLAAAELFVNEANELRFRIGNSPWYGPFAAPADNILMNGGCGIYAQSATTATGGTWPTTFDARNF